MTPEPALFLFLTQRARYDLAEPRDLCVNGLGWAALLLTAFIILAIAALGGHLEGFDRHLLLALRTGDTHEPIGPQWVETMFLDITGLGSTVIVTLVTLATAAFLFMAGRRGTAWLVLAAAGGGTLLNNLLKLIFDRARPDLVAHSVETATTSFPSGHSMLTAVVYLTLGALLARTQDKPAIRIYILSLAVFVTAIVGISRVYLGVHWPTDVLAGWIAGGAWALICWNVASRLQGRGHIERAD